MRCIHISQRCISSRQMTGNIFEIETTALAHVACAPQESGILLTDFAAAYSSVNCSWIFDVLEKTELPGFICRFLRRISETPIALHIWNFAGMTRGHFLMARGVRQGCAIAFALSSDGSRKRSSQGTLLVWTSSSQFHAPLLMTSQWLLHHFVA